MIFDLTENQTDQSFHLFVMCIEKSNVVILSMKSTATGVKCPRGYRYINYVTAFVSLFWQPSTVFRNFALNRYPITGSGREEGNFLFYLYNFADTEGGWRSMTGRRARSAIVGHLWKM